MGYVALYNPDDQLLLSGGITSSRGHEGDNAGEDLVVAGVNGKPVSPQAHTGLRLQFEG